MTPGETVPPAVSLTVVVITLAGGAELERCLRGVARIPARRLVMARPDLAARFADTWPQFEWHPAAGPVPERRSLGLAAATTDWVAIIEDTCEPASTWYAAMTEIATSDEGAAWSGPVAISLDLAPRFMALACTEYAEFTPENWTRLAIAPAIGTARQIARIPGLNLVYRRSALADCSVAAGLVESDLHPELRRRGMALVLHPGLAVTYFAADRGNAAVPARYSHGRIYGGGIAERSSPWPRLLGAAKCLALPVVLSWRALRGLPRHYRPRGAALGWIVAFSCAWACGEFLGLLAGRGKSVQSWA